MATNDTETPGAIPTLEDWQHWTWVMGRAQQLMMEAWADNLNKDQPFPSMAAANPAKAMAAAVGSGTGATAKSVKVRTD